MESYPNFVRRLKKHPHLILDTLPQKDAAHMLIGLYGEVGELTDAIKKNIVYSDKLDLENVIEEMGDIEFYLEGLRQVYKITRTEVVAANVTKLKKRYEAGYSDEAAKERKDKA